MGRKGVSKRKPKQTKSKPYASGSEPSIVKAAESQPVGKASSDLKKPTMKG